MKFLFDLFPVLLFFAAYSISQDIFLATATAIVATVGQVIFSWLRYKKVDKMLWLSLLLITVLGGATLLLHNKTFIFWKPTALYWTLATTLLLSRAFFGKNPMRQLMQDQLSLPDPIWERVNYAWAAFFSGMGGLNLYVAYHFTENIWVKFKLFGGLGLTLLFVLGQGIALARYLEEPSNPKEK